ncbi:hypothetical protein GCM10011588_58350 [Nocardia jinanensis]|uniref:Uncharacterized protein n=1 Tax=Nocardia jinanensis TaxID=382504 RepID=A0A917VYA3_9NOCA|nr:hypothetical protein GCM10011588_58350 [Nocardia jinanensis]
MTQWADDTTEFRPDRAFSVRGEHIYRRPDAVPMPATGELPS